ncbi:hypothetical protein F4859DRAFT_527667 [Xylaria cf. heliscus]|nr:hypothetical protein F4859DRAFT_527667 [Xylaria cf. heliscus]
MEPTIPFLETKAFDLTPNEKDVMLGKVKTLLLLVGSRIQHARESGASTQDWHDTLDLVNKALLIAKDEDACDQSLTPLLLCYLYKGHSLLALGEEEKAYEEYRKAATGKPQALTDFPAVQQAAKLLQERQDKPAEKESTASKNPPADPGSNPSGNSGSAGERPDSLLLSSGVDEIPLLVTVHPGPERRRSSEDSGPNKTSGDKDHRGR